jgi:DNA (cytosine-5)-methyltransferase 1
MLTVLDLFSGIGGFSLGLERAGMRTIAFCECDRYCRMVLRVRWPGVKCYEHIEALSAARLAADGIAQPDVICGGFPCQDISLAGSGAGLAGERSGLWREFARLIGELRPRFAIVENVAALRRRGLAAVLGDLAALGYDAEWHCIPASALGAPHRRDRLWVLAYAHGRRCESIGESQYLCEPGSFWSESNRRDPRGSGTGPTVADSDGAGLAIGPATAAARARSGMHARGNAGGPSTSVPDTGCGSGQGSGSGERGGQGAPGWAPEPNVGRVAHGIPARVDRLKGLGNSLVPQIPELIGRAIIRRLSVL